MNLGFSADTKYHLRNISQQIYLSNKMGRRPIIMNLMITSSDDSCFNVPGTFTSATDAALATGFSGWGIRLAYRSPKASMVRNCCTYNFNWGEEPSEPQQPSEPPEPSEPQQPSEPPEPLEFSNHRSHQNHRNFSNHRNLQQPLEPSDHRNFSNHRSYQNHRNFSNHWSHQNHWNFSNHRSHQTH